MLMSGNLHLGCTLHMLSQLLCKQYAFATTPCDEVVVRHDS